MKIIHLVLINLFLLLISCNDVQNIEQTQPIEEISPETLDNSESNVRAKIKSARSSNINWESYSDRDIINELFEEAIKKNADLRKLIQEMETIQSAKSDSLSTTKNYISNNEKFYNQVNDYLNQLSDSILKVQVKSIFDKEEQQFEYTLENHKKSMDLIFQKSNSLNQQLILMKIFIANSMIKNYQKENVPDIKSLEKLIENYDVLIKETGKYVK